MHVLKHLVKSIALLCALGLSGTTASAQGQAWPTRSVKFILPLGPGSGADIAARLIAERLATRWGHPVVVENRPGGDGFVAIGAFTGAKDDHVLLFGPASSFVAHPYLHEKLPYDPRDLVPVTRITNTVVSVVVPGSAKASSLADVFAEARANPGKLNWATITGVTDFVMLGFLKDQKLDMAKVPYRDPVQALNDLAESRIHFYVAAYAITRAQVQAGRVKLLAVTNGERAPVIKDTPTVAQAGFPGLDFDGLVGIYGPRDLPQQAQERITADVREIVADPAILQRLEATGQLVRPGGPAEFAASIDRQRAGLVGTARILGVKAAQ